MTFVMWVEKKRAALHHLAPVKSYFWLRAHGRNNSNHKPELRMSLADFVRHILTVSDKCLGVLGLAAFFPNEVDTILERDLVRIPQRTQNEHYNAFEVS